MSEEYHSALELYEDDQQDLKLKAERQMLERLRIGSRVAVTFSTKFDDEMRMVSCKPYTRVGDVVGLELYNGRGQVSIHFEGDELPTGTFSPLDTMLIEESQP